MYVAFGAKGSVGVKGCKYMDVCIRLASNLKNMNVIAIKISLALIFCFVFSFVLGVSFFSFSTFLSFAAKNNYKYLLN